MAVIHRILGVDPGLANTGWGVVDSDGIRHKTVDYGTIITESGLPMEHRLLHIHRELTSVITGFRPAALSVEALFFAKNISSAIPVAQARGVIMLTAVKNGLEVREFQPVDIKKSVVGTGAATKNQIRIMLALLLHLEEGEPKSEHAADALAAAITLIHHMDFVRKHG